ncbi:MAG: MmcB family DNA repair protein [Pseudomonadota bacterium]|nr:MmcB family DNA repair protein [Pseudomonadota bacterium]
MFAMSSTITYLDAPKTTQLITRGVCRMLQNLGFGTLTEFKLSSGRRVDVMAIDRNGDFVIVEVKSSVSDYRADRKWQEYLAFSERFYFAVPTGFPIEIMPDDRGLIVADPYDAAIRRECFPTKLNAIPKRQQLIRFAIEASRRLRQIG